MFGHPDNYASTDMSRETGELYSEETNGRWNAGACGSIIVNRRGLRFVAEDASYVFDTMEELADGMGIDKRNLLDTVERWNGFCEEGVDRDFGRGVNTWGVFLQGDQSRVDSGELKNPCLAPLEKGPFYCVELYPAMLQTAGGMEINANAQVKDVRGEVISRLYAGSTCIANTMGRAYPFGGTMLANGFVVGYVAANHIATLMPWE